MSFITKRERVFNEYDLFDLPSRNEGKLKAYASCTDARAWSHFCSDKSEHLVEIIKRNNESCRPKYLPTDVIVDTLMATKNAEIARLKRKIEEFEQMLAVYDQLDLTCDQKCDIAAAHAAIKAANKELDELCLDLDLSGFTEGIDSEAFETGKSRGDEPARYRGDETGKSKTSELPSELTTPQKQSKDVQMGSSCVCDVSTSARDTRIEQMQEAIINKDAKLNAMQNTIAVMENDVCEPYCIYAHIYTAIEKIFATLCQNDKYRRYLDLLTAGKDTYVIDIKGKILFKLKVLEKFSLALIAPCSQEIKDATDKCSCYRVEIYERVETALALTSTESEQPSLDNKRAQLVADIIENEEMKEILSKERTSDKEEDEDQMNNSLVIENYNINTENLKRLKDLQASYDDLMTCYENLKHNRDCLQIRCHKYADVEKELECLKNQLTNYNLLWHEKEHYQKRSEDLDILKEQFLVLSDETSNLETKLKVEIEINKIKSNTVDELQKTNITLEKKLNEASIAFEKEKNTLECKLKETECQVMCQEQQIKSLSAQIDRLLEQDHNNLNQETLSPLTMIDDIESKKGQIKNLMDVILCSEEEKQRLQEEFQDKLNYINELKMEIEDWKSTYEKTFHRNEYLEKYTEDFREEARTLIEENKTLLHDVEEKTTAVENLINVINNKSQEINKLMEELERKKIENKRLFNEYQELQEKYGNNIKTLEDEKQQAFNSLQLARQESLELLEKVKDYDDMLHKQSDLNKSIEIEAQNCKEIRDMYLNSIEENKKLQQDVANRESNNSVLLQEIQRLREVNNYAVENINVLQGEKTQFKKSLELSRKESEILENKLSQFDVLSQKFLNLRESHETLVTENAVLQKKIQDKEHELLSAHNINQITKKESEELLDKLQQSENLKDDIIKLSAAYQKLVNEKNMIQKDLMDKERELNCLLKSLSELKTENELLLKKSQHTSNLEGELENLKRAYEELVVEKNILQCDYNNKSEGINNLYNTLENKIEENRELTNYIKTLQGQQEMKDHEIIEIKNEYSNTQTALDSMKKESTALVDTLKHYEYLEDEYNKLKNAHDQMKLEKERLQNVLDKQLINSKKIEEENHELDNQTRNLMTHAEDLERALTNARNELIAKTTPSEDLCSDIRTQIEDMKKEKNLNQDKIRDLTDKLDEAEIVISSLNEKVIARENKIASLENYINELEDEVRKLHNNLEEIIDTGEQIRNNSYLKIDQSLKKMEAHHSKATHNMKAEIAKLQNENLKLDEQLSSTRLKSEETFRDKHKYLTENVSLQNERELIVTDIKQLEMESVGDSALSPNNCDVEAILTSLERIRKYIDARNTKSTSLENMLLKVKSKADEAKQIVEKEKQKSIHEKEEAIKDRIIMEKQLVELKENLEKQILHDKDVIKDLEAEILNQKLIIDKINESTQNYISKLEEELDSLKNLYHNSVTKISELQEKITNISEENNKNVEIIGKTKFDLEEKSKEITVLQNLLEEVKAIPKRNASIQAMPSVNYRNMSCQTNKEIIDENCERNNNIELEFNQDNKDKSTESMPDVNVIKMNLQTHDKKKIDIQSKQQPNTINEVQILTANIEPAFDFVKNTYLNYKLKRLTLGRLEQYSISCLVNSTDFNLLSNNEVSSLQSENFFNENEMLSHTTEKTYDESSFQNHNLINIYERQSAQTSSSKVISSDDIKNIKNIKSKESQNSMLTGFGLINEIFGSTQDENKNKQKNSKEQTNTSQDIFVIYKDSEKKDLEKDLNNEQDYNETILKDQQNALRPDFTKHVSKSKLPKNIDQQIYKQNNKTMSKTMDPYIVVEEEDDENDDDSVKPKLNVNLPRVEVDNPLTDTNSEEDRKSQNFYSLTLYPSQKSIVLSDTNAIEEIKIDNQETPSLAVIYNDDNYQLLQSIDSPKKLSNGEIEKQMSYMKTNPTKPVEPRQVELLTKKDKKNLSEKYRADIPQKEVDKNESYHNLFRVGGDVFVIKPNSKKKKVTQKNNQKTKTPTDFGLQYILDTVQHEVNPDNINTHDIMKGLRKARSDEHFDETKSQNTSHSSPLKLIDFKVSSTEYSSQTPTKIYEKIDPKQFVDFGVMVKTDLTEDYENKIKYLSKALENIEKDYKKKIEAIKLQYDSNIKGIINEHNQGVKSIQSLHEETLQDIINIHENEIENLRTMSIEAMRKVEKVEKENKTLKTKIHNFSLAGLDEEPVKITTDVKKRKSRSRGDSKTLTKTNVEAFNVKPKIRSLGPCTCSLDINISDTIRNIFEQVDIDQRKMAEHTYLKYIANKILTNNVEALDAQELSFLHFKVCRTWKLKLSKEEALQKKIDCLENELINKQRNAQQHIAELDRKVAEERRRLQEVREAVCRSSPNDSESLSPEPITETVPLAPPPTTAEKDFGCSCNTTTYNVCERRSTEELVSDLSEAGLRHKRIKTETNRAVLAKLDIEERRQKKIYGDEPPTRLRRSHERPVVRTHKK